jgi:cell fate regulator YaaT (PSP1 superfamily)
MDFIYNKGGSCCIDGNGCCKRGQRPKTVYDWLADAEEGKITVENKDPSARMVEVQFKTTRKGYYTNADDLPLKVGDMVAVEASPGHDIGTVSLIGRLVRLQMKKNNIDPDEVDLRKIYRIARPADIDRYKTAKAREHETMVKARKIAVDLALDMKIGDVEFQGDGSKAIFYYIAEGRIDFRQLIRLFAESFHVRVEMRQIGARQEAGRIGGIGPCGRELCCSGWMNNFETVSTGAARSQDISMNPQKLAGQCSKLRCCFNHELETYLDAQKQLPPRETLLETQAGSYHCIKVDVFKEELTYSGEHSSGANLVTIPAQRVFEVIEMNRQGEKPLTLASNEPVQLPQRDAQDILGANSLTRFDQTRNNSKKRKNRRPQNRRQP